MTEKQILLNSSLSKRSVNINNSEIVQLEQTYRLLPVDSVVDQIDAYKVYENERNSSDTYRLIFTINSVCSNVLFNALTEIMKDEGSDNVIFLDNLDKTVNVVFPNINQRPINTSNLNRNSGIKNTEYSNKKCGFVYHCGYDIFNNHILRSNTFKTVNQILPSDSATPRGNFNTISDLMRLDSGSQVKFKLPSSPTTESNLHLYEYADLMAFYDSIQTNLIEQDGWLGFINITKIPTLSSPSSEPDSIINRTLNNNKSCEFIDMYPDRSLFSFVPKVNKFRNRLEYNWHYTLTYPYKTETNSLVDFNFENEGGVITKENGLQIISGESTLNANNTGIVIFRCAHKHGLFPGAKIRLYYGINTAINMTGVVNTLITVQNIGDTTGRNGEYSFFINSNDLDDYGLLNSINNLKFRFNRVVNGINCTYYFRIFRKIPNFKFSKELPTVKNLQNEDFLNEHSVSFDSSINKLAFSNNIYSDDIVQIVFTDDINLRGLTDNLNRPLSEMYLTIVKNNRGHDKWYDKDNPKYSGEDIEFSHAFGKVSSGLDLPYESFLVNENTNSVKDNGYHNIKYLTNLSTYLHSTPIENDIKIEQNEFYGDLVEFNVSDVSENIIEYIHHRVNTGQRETESKLYDTLTYQEIISDDYDIQTENNQKVGFKIATKTFPVDGEESEPINQRPEGYFYKPHFKVPLKEFDITINQGQQENLLYSDYKNVGNNEWLVTTKIKYPIEDGDYINVVVVNNGRELERHPCKVSRVLNRFKFFITIPNIVNNSIGRILFFRNNSDIPPYGVNLEDGSGIFLWRNQLTSGNYNSTLPVYPFTNNSFYIHENLNFFLRRQDPFGLSLRTIDNSIPDIGGVKRDISEYDYYNMEGNSLC